MIRTEDIYFTYPSGTKALLGVTVEIKDNEFVAIMGENGAGKSTLVKHFNGLLKPSKGEIYVDGVNTRRASVAELSRKVGLVFQNPDHQLFCETVEEEIVFGLKNFGFEEDVIAKKVEWVLDFLNIARYRKLSPFMLSGGERKRVALAAVLAWDPKIIVLDEPTIGQDYAQKEKLRQFIKTFNAQGKIVVMVTHDVEFVADCAPRIIILSGGKIEADGSAKEILTDRETLLKASIIPPQITQIINEMSDLGLQKDIIDIYEAKEIIEGGIQFHDGWCAFQARVIDDDIDLVVLQSPFSGLLLNSSEHGVSTLWFLVRFESLIVLDDILLDLFEITDYMLQANVLVFNFLKNAVCGVAGDLTVGFFQLLLNGTFLYLQLGDSVLEFLAQFVSGTGQFFFSFLSQVLVVFLTHWFALL